MIIALAVLAIRQKALVRPTIVAAVLVIAQGILGRSRSRRTSRRGWWRRTSGWPWRCSRCSCTCGARAARPRAAPRAPDEPRLRLVAMVASGLVLVTIVAGGYMAGTQKYGRPDYQLGDGAHHACGKEFPTCNGGFMPYGDARLVDIHLTHRFFMYLAVIAVVVLAVMLFRRGMKRHAYELTRAAGGPGPARRAQRVARRVRAADPGPPRPSARCCGRRRSTPSSSSAAPRRGSPRGRPRTTGGRLMERRRTQHAAPAGARSSRTTSR